MKLFTSYTLTNVALVTRVQTIIRAWLKSRKLPHSHPLIQVFSLQKATGKMKCVLARKSASFSSASSYPSHLMKCFSKGFVWWSPRGTESRSTSLLCWVLFLILFWGWMWYLPSSSHRDLSRSENTALQWHPDKSRAVLCTLLLV